MPQYVFVYMDFIYKWSQTTQAKNIYILINNYIMPYN